MAALVQLTLLGGFGVRRTNRGDVRLPTRKAEALLAYLACHPGEKQPRDRLTALLWGDRGDKQARHSLSQTLLSLRQELGEANSLLLIERETVALRADAVECDVLEFRRLAAMPGELRTALDLYRGPFLDGFSLREPGFEDWLIEERNRLQGMAFSTFLALADAQTAAGDWNAAMSTLNSAIRFDPLAEEAYRRLMTLQIEQGLCNDAIRNYRALADALRRELKTQPDPSTTAIYQRATARPQQSIQPQGLSEPGGEIDIVAGEPVAPVQREATGPRRASIAIMPFIDLEAGREGKLPLARGLSHDLITRLAKLRSVFVIAQGTVFALAEKGVSAEEAGRMLNVDYVASGTLRNRDGHVSVSRRAGRDAVCAHHLGGHHRAQAERLALDRRRGRQRDREFDRVGNRADRAQPRHPQAAGIARCVGGAALRLLAHVPLQRGGQRAAPSGSSSSPCGSTRPWRGPMPASPSRISRTPSCCASASGSRRSRAPMKWRPRR